MGSESHNRQPDESPSMRPDIEISHTKNGRIKDFAAERGIKTSEAYAKIIDAGLEALVGDAPTIVWTDVRAECGFDDAELAAAQAVVDYCAQHRGATKEQLLAEVYPEYATGKSEDWWWRQIVTEYGLEAAGVLDGSNARVMEAADE
jgi:hypothetical protein